jgi:putative (di)nucleoside polyphosphate hydrolase
MSDVIDRDGFRANVGMMLMSDDGKLFIARRAGDVQIVGRTRHWLRYRLPPRYVRHHVRPLCLGQKQHWFLLRLRHPEIRFRFDLTPEPEFDRWRWVDYWQPIREVIYFKRAVYTRALHELGALAFPGGPPPYPPWWRQRSATLKAAAPTAL